MISNTEKGSKQRENPSTRRSGPDFVNRLYLNPIVKSDLVTSGDVTIHFLLLRASIRNGEMNWLCNNQMTSWIDKIWIWFLFMNNHADSLKITENHENHVNSRRDWKLDRSRMVKIKQSRCQTFIFRGKWLFYSKESEMFQLDCFYSAHMECERN